MKRVVSYSYFLDDASVYNKPERGAKRYLQFVQFLPLIVRAHHVIWPGWTLRIHHDDRVTKLPYFPALEKLAESGIIELQSVGVCDAICGSRGMLARLRPVFDSDVEYVACRDIDSVPMPKDRRCVEEFIKTQKALHGINDHEQHSGIMGGLSAFHASKFRSISRTDSVENVMGLYGKDIDYKRHGADQDLLNRLACHVFPHHEILLHELHHRVGVVPGESRSKVADFDTGIDGEVLEKGDAFSPMLGGCVEPIPAFNFYDKPRFLHNGLIASCELRAGVVARSMMEEIAAL